MSLAPFTLAGFAGGVDVFVSLVVEHADRPMPTARSTQEAFRMMRDGSSGRDISTSPTVTPDSLYDIGVKSISGETQSLGAYRGKTLLIVNVASQCGFTPQYAGLEALYRKYKDQGFVVLGFPCNQFGRQEPGTDSEIQQFCATTYDVTFPLFAKIDVNGAAAHPLYALLKSAKPGLLGTEAIKWNFTKFLVNGLGDVLVRYAPSDTPDKLDQEIAKVLAAPLPKRA